MTGYLPVAIFLGLIVAFGVVALLAATRRSVGWSLTAVVLVCILYAWLGAYIPGSAGHSGSCLKTPQRHWSLK